MRHTLWALALASILGAPAAFAAETVHERADQPQPWVEEEGDEPGLVSLRKKGTIKIGGSAWIAAYAGRYDGGAADTAYYGYGDPGVASAWNTRNQKYNVTDFSTNTAKLDFEVAASENSSLFIKLSLDDAWGDAPDFQQDEFLEEIYFEFREILGQDLALRFGKQAIAFGMHRDDLLMSPYIADMGNSGFAAWFNNPNVDLESDYDGNPLHLAAVDHDFAVQVEWKPKFTRDLLKIEASVFQDRDSRGVNHRRRSDDNLFFQSYAGRLTFSPVEKLDLYVSGLSRYNDSADSGKHNYAYSVGFNAPLFRLPVEIFAEYQRSIRNGYIEGVDSDNVHAGIIWSIRDNLRLNLQGEWLRIDRSDSSLRSQMGGSTLLANADLSEKDTFYRTLVALEYDLASNITVEGGWQREWYNRDSNAKDVTTYDAGTGLNYSAKGDVWYLGLKYDF